MATLRRVVFALLGLALGGGLCVYVFSQAAIGRADWVALLSSSSLLSCVLVVILTHALMLVGARKWEILAEALRKKDEPIPEPAFFYRHFLWQSWIGQFVPPSLAIIFGRGLASRHLDRAHRQSQPSLAEGVILQTEGGEGVWAAIRHKNFSLLRGLGSGLFDQAMAFALLTSFGGGSVLVLWFGGGVLAFLGGTVCGVAGIALVTFIVQRWMPPQWRQAIWSLFFWSFVWSGLTILRLVVGVQALGLFLSCIKVAALAPVISLLALIPLTPGNLGIAEWGWQAGLVWAGQGVVAATLYAAGFRVLILIAQSLLLGLNEAYVAFTKN